MNDNNKNDQSEAEKKSAGQILPDDKKHLKDQMPDHVKSPMNDLKDKSNVVPKEKK